MAHQNQNGHAAPDGQMYSQGFAMPSFAPASNSNVPTITAADLHELFSSDFAAYTPMARELTAPDGSHLPLGIPMPSGPPGTMRSTSDGSVNSLGGPAAVAPLYSPPGSGPGPSNLSQAEAEAEANAMLYERARAMAQAARPKRKRPDGAAAFAGDDFDDMGAGGAGMDDFPKGGGGEDHKMERRLRNREHAKRSRLRKRFLLESLQSQLTELRDENKVLRDAVKARIPDRAQQILNECTQTQSDLLEDLDGVNRKLRPRVSLPNSNGDGGPSLSGEMAELSRQLVEQDYRLIRALQHSQQCFAISDPALPDNPIVYASQGFLELTGYSMRQVLGRNCRFLQGPGTDQFAVQEIRDGISEGRDVTVCLLNYKADGTPFWNQFFIAPLSAATGEIVNFVGVQCEVQSNRAEDMQQRVKKIKNIEDYVDE